NSLILPDADTRFGQPAVMDNPTARTFLATFPTAAGGRVLGGLTDASLLTYALAQTQSLTITPALLTGTLKTGTAVVLQASNDVTVNSAIIVSAGGQGGALTVQ